MADLPAEIISRQLGVALLKLSQIKGPATSSSEWCFKTEAELSGRWWVMVDPRCL